MITRRGLLKALGGLVFTGFATSSYAFGIEPMLRLRTAEYRLRPANWPKGLKRIVALADIHACEPWMSARRIGRICEAANALEGELIVLLGDYAAGMNLVTGYVHSEDWSKAMSILRAPLGVHAIMGNHDWWEDLTAQRAGGGDTFGHRALRDVGVEVHANAARRLERDGHAFWLAGLEDQLALRPGKRRGRKSFVGLDDLDGTLAQVTDDAPVILLANEPDIFPRVPSRVCLTLSGHTHGGQVRFLGYAPVVPSAHGNRYAYGHVVEQGRDIIISGGLGCSIAPIRFGSPPELTVIELG